jgi:hypothetical protein
MNIEMPEFDSVLLKTIYIFTSNEDEPELIQPVLAVGYPHSLFTVNPSQGISFQSESAIHFGDSAQQVVSILGAPAYVTYKNLDILSIHSSQKPHLKPSDYFYNYFNHGMDILFDGVAHTVKKFVLRANLPTNSLFDLYRKCLFEIIPPKKLRLDDADEEDFAANKSIHPDMKVV